MDQANENVKRIANLEELLCDLANAVSMGCDAEAAVVAREAQEFLNTGERGAITKLEATIARQQAFGEAAQTLLRMARRGHTNLSDAAKVISEMAGKSAVIAVGGAVAWWLSK